MFPSPQNARHVEQISLRLMTTSTPLDTPGHRAALKLLEKMPQSTNQRFHNRCRAQGRAAFFISTSCFGPKWAKDFLKKKTIFFQYDPVSSSQDHLFTIRCQVVLCPNSTVIHSHILITIIKLISFGSNTLCN